VFLKDIHQEDRERAIGSCTNARAYRIFSRAAELLGDKGLINTQVGEIAVCVCDGFATLPRECEMPLAFQVNGCPAIARNQWFTYHISGPGDKGATPIGYVDILGHNYPTCREPDRPVKLALRIRSASDANKEFRVFGYAQNGERIYSENADGEMVDGFLLPTVFGSLRTASSITSIVKIELISKVEFVDWCELYAVDPDTNEAISLLGKYAPEETTPQYTRIRVPCQNVVRVKFKRKALRLLSEDDWIPCDHEQAYLMACKSIAKLDNDQFDAARWCESEAERMIKERQNARRPGGIAPPQVTVTATNFGSGGLHYS
jgi:hypothetical protein